MLNDTIGFIRDLPPKLIKSFSSTLEDSIESDLLLHVIDASDPFVEERIDVVHQVLSDIGANQEKILVFNKIDLINEEKKADPLVDFSSPENSPSKMRDTYYHFLMKSLERPFEERGKAFLEEEKRLLIRSKADPEILPSLPLFPI